MGAQLSEVLNAEVTSSEEGGFSRRRVVKGVAWSVPVIVTAIAAPAAAASGGATATFIGGTANIPSTTQPNGNGHLRSNVAVPVTLSLASLAGVTGLINVVMTISPATPAIGDPSVSFSTVQVGTVSVSPVLVLTGNVFTATFAYALPAGSTQVNFAIGGYTYRGKAGDRRDFQVAAAVTLVQNTKTVSLSPTSTISL